MIPPLIFFDIDQTIAESKQPITPAMAETLTRLLEVTNVGIISGDTYDVVLKNVANQLPSSANHSHLYLLPTSGAVLYAFKDGVWKALYSETLSEDAVASIYTAINEAIAETAWIDMNTPSYGDRIEFRGAQVSISALGQKAPIELKKVWDPSGVKRDTLRTAIAKRLPEYDVARGGMTTIDITRKGVNKGYGVRKLAEHLNLPVGNLMYVGDALYEGGNDAVVKETGIPTHSVRDPNDTLIFIEELLG